MSSSLHRAQSWPQMQNINSQSSIDQNSRNGNENNTTNYCHLHTCGGILHMDEDDIVGILTPGDDDNDHIIGLTGAGGIVDGVGVVKKLNLTNSTNNNVTQLQATRRLLCRHYYPEGGWGWIIATVGVLVQILTHGIQLSYSQLIMPASRKFHVAPIHSAGVGFSGSYSGIEYDGNATHNPDGTPIPGRCSIHHHRHRNGGGDIEIDKASYAANKLVADIRQLLTLKQHYYPEGNWGWVIVFVSVLVQILTHGLQVGSGVLTQEIVNKFGKQIMLPAGLNYHDSNDNEEQYHRHRRHHRHRSHGSNTTVGSNLTFKHAAHCTANTIRQHYYPEGGWGWIIVFVAMIVQILTHGLHLAWGVLLIETLKKFPKASYVDTGWLGALSTGVALLVSPVTIAFCRRKSTRLTAVMGGLVTALGCLFTSFASQFHQLFFSYGTVVGVGVGMTRDCSTLMVAQYFKRRREFVEIFIVSGSGLGIAIMSAFIKGAISAIGWRFGLQVITVAVFFTFFLGTFYRSASLYHPQRRAILHLKNQKRKIKDKNKVDDRPPFFDFSTLRSKTVRILLMSTGISAFGINTPIFYLAHQAEEEGLGDTAVLLQTYLGLAWTLGCAAFGILVVHNNVECRIARQYLCQAAVFMCGLSILALTAVKGNYHGYVMFAWIYGIFCGGYHYSLKMYTYERVRARNFARTWGFVQCSQAIPIAIGVPISGYINVGCGGKAGYYFSSTCVLVGSLALFLIDLHRRNLSRHKHTRANGTKHLCVSDNCPQRRRLSFTQEPDNDGLAGAPGATAAAALIVGNDLDGHHHPADGYIDTIAITDKPELTCISEEGIADMDLPDNILDDLDYIGDCITSCNKVENYLMLSEFENNLIAEMPVILDRKGRRWSIAKSRQNTQIGNAPGIPEEVEVEDPNETSVTMHQQHQSAPLNSGRPTSGNNKWTNKPSNNATEKSNFIQQRTITVIDEASV